MSRVPPSGLAVGMLRTLAYAKWNGFRRKKKTKTNELYHGRNQKMSNARMWGATMSFLNIIFCTRYKLQFVNLLV